MASDTCPTSRKGLQMPSIGTHLWINILLKGSLDGLPSRCLEKDRKEKN